MLPPSRLACMLTMVPFARLASSSTAATPAEGVGAPPVVFAVAVGSNRSKASSVSLRHTTGSGREQKPGYQGEAGVACIAFISKSSSSSNSSSKAKPG